MRPPARIEFHDRRYPLACPEWVFSSLQLVNADNLGCHVQFFTTNCGTLNARRPNSPWRGHWKIAKRIYYREDGSAEVSSEKVDPRHDEARRSDRSER